MDIYIQAFKILGPIAAVQLAIYFLVKDKYMRFILMSVVGVGTMVLILAGAVILRATNVAIYMTVLLVAYILTLSYIWKHRV